METYWKILLILFFILTNAMCLKFLLTKDEKFKKTRRFIAIGGFIICNIAGLLILNLKF